MGTKTTKRVVIEVAGTPKAILSFAERKDGDLKLLLKPAALFRNSEKSIKEAGDSTYHGRAVREQRYSLHPSLDSPEKINQFKHTIVFDDNSSISTSQFTRAIKQTNKFAPIFFRRFPDLSENRYDCSRDEIRNISLGKLAPKEFTLFFGVFASRRGRKFNHLSYKHYEYLHIEFAIFEILILYMFLGSGPINWVAWSDGP